ncbi:hypothetical protein H6B10_17585, partial [Gemmiger formicilis]|uniref:hypothetical protein n=1 Tax=Gemmiger formicilis TaxID=745368 RepID=UPI001956CECE
CAPLMVERQRDGLSRWSGRSSPFPMFNPSMYRLYRCGEDGENFCSLTNEQVERYLARFRELEIICDMPDAII